MKKFQRAVSGTLSVMLVLLAVGFAASLVIRADDDAVQSAYLQRYESAQARIQELNVAVAANRNTIAHVTLQLGILLQMVDAFMESDADVGAMVDVLLGEVESITYQNANMATRLTNYQATITSNQIHIGELEASLAVANNEISILSAEVTRLLANNLELQMRVMQLENQRDLLLQAIEAYRQLVESLRYDIINQRFVVTFMFDDTVYSLVLVPVGGRVEIVNPAPREYTIFLGWSFSQGGELVDLTYLTPTADTVLYAVIIRKFNVNFVFEHTIHAHRIAQQGTFVTDVPNPANTNRRVFLGWTLNGVDIVDPSTHQIWEHTVFFARIDNRARVDFQVHNELYRYMYVSQVQLGLDFAPSVGFGYQFNYWTFDGQRINPMTFVVPGDIVLVASVSRVAVVIWTGSHTQTFNQNSRTFDLNNLINMSQFNGGQFSTIEIIATGNFTAMRNGSGGGSASVPITLNNQSSRSVQYCDSRITITQPSGVPGVPGFQFSTYRADLSVSVNAWNQQINITASRRGGSMTSSNNFNGNLTITSIRVWL